MKKIICPKCKHKFFIRNKKMEEFLKEIKEEEKRDREELRSALAGSRYPSAPERDDEA